MVLHLSVVFSSLNVVFRIGRALNTRAVLLFQRVFHKFRASLLLYHRNSTFRAVIRAVLYTFRQFTSWSHFIEPSRPVNIAKTIRSVSIPQCHIISFGHYEACALLKAPKTANSIKIINSAEHCALVARLAVVAIVFFEFLPQTLTYF